MPKNNNSLNSKKRPFMIGDENTTRAKFSNVVNIFVNEREMFIDFGMVDPKDKNDSNGETVYLQSRVVLTLDHAKELEQVLQKVLTQYDTRNE